MNLPLNCDEESWEWRKKMWRFSVFRLSHFPRFSFSSFNLSTFPQLSLFHSSIKLNILSPFPPLLFLKLPLPLPYFAFSSHCHSHPHFQVTSLSPEIASLFDWSTEHGFNRKHKVASLILAWVSFYFISFFFLLQFASTNWFLLIEIEAESTKTSRK